MTEWVFSSSSDGTFCATLPNGVIEKVEKASLILESWDRENSVEYQVGWRKFEGMTLGQMRREMYK